MAGTANYAGIVKWAQLDLQRIQHRDYVGHLSISFQKILQELDQPTRLDQVQTF